MYKVYYVSKLRVNRSAKCKVWRVSRDTDVKNHDLGGVIAKDAKLWMQFCILKTLETEIQGCEVKGRQFLIKSEVQTLRTESSMDIKSDSGSFGLYLQHIFKNQPWLLWESGETASNLHAHCLIVPFVNSTHIYYMEHFEDLAVATAPNPPRVWERYVDDAICILKKTAFQQTLSHINASLRRPHGSYATVYAYKMAIYIKFIALHTSPKKTSLMRTPWMLLSI